MTNSETSKDGLRNDKPLDSQEVIATRVYVVHESAPADVVRVRLGRPTLRESDGLYECGTEIVESGRCWVRRLVGVDEFEALQVALMLLGTDLDHINNQLRASNEALSWGKERQLELKFPLPPFFCLNPEGDA